VAEEPTTGIGLAIQLIQSSIDSLRSEVSTGLGNISTRLDTKADRSDVGAVIARLDRMESENDSHRREAEIRFRTIEDSRLTTTAVTLRDQADKRRKLTVMEKVAAVCGTVYIGGMPLLVWLLSINPRH
jgi:hypothetical protein